MKYNKLIDHTVLKADTSQKQVEKVISEALEYDFASVCINPFWVPLAKEQLEGSDVKVCTVIGFPLGANTKEIKVLEAQNALDNGADEIDMVINIAKVKERDSDYLLEEIGAIKEAIGKKILKVIVETALLDEEEKEYICKIVIASGADFIKTSTGFSTGGATVEDVELFNKLIKGKIEIKASGGVRTLEDLEKMVKAGATRIGTSGGVAIIQGLENKESY